MASMALLLGACAAVQLEHGAHASTVVVENLSFELIGTMAHRPQAFTQGFVLGNNNTLYESSGNYGESHLVRLEPGSGHRVAARTDLPKRLFAEGLALHDNKLYLLSWKAGVCLVYNATSLQQLGNLEYRGQGWGLSSNEHQLVMSNGSHQLTFRDPITFAVNRTLNVTLHGRPLTRLNELEWVNELIYANIWYDDTVVAISSETGDVVAQLDLSALRRYEHKTADALNGIAYKPSTDTFLVTGKYWSQIYEIKLKRE
ncbi:MAG: glutaminyl-peptide cyclotransferase [Pseudomonadales bacterium]